jgi:hypothetical protein
MWGGQRVIRGYKSRAEEEEEIVGKFGLKYVDPSLEERQGWCLWVWKRMCNGSMGIRGRDVIWLASDACVSLFLCR